MKIEIKEPRPNHDHRAVFMDGKYVGFCPLTETTIRLQKCPKCDRENYAMAVMSGQCCWCGFDVNKDC